MPDRERPVKIMGNLNIGGEFEGVAGIIMRIKGDSRVVVVIPNLLSMATAYIPAGLVVAVE